MKLITLYLPEPYIEALDRLVNKKFYPNRAEAIRSAIHDLLRDEFWIVEKKRQKKNRRRNGNGRKKRKSVRKRGA